MSGGATLVSTRHVRILTFICLVYEFDRAADFLASVCRLDIPGASHLASLGQVGRSSCGGISLRLDDCRSNSRMVQEVPAKSEIPGTH